MQPRLYVSFWDIELSNLPVGSFRRRVLSTAEARSVIRSARASGTLLCVAKEDLGAPYCEEARERHRELCAALREYVDIEIELKDFFGEACANPLALPRSGSNRASWWWSVTTASTQHCAAMPPRQWTPQTVPAKPLRHAFGAG
jgi:hypothetical protein